MSPPGPFRLKPADSERYVRMRRRMLEDAPWAFAASVEDDVALDAGHMTKALAGEYNAILAIEAADSRELVAVAGVMRQKRAKFAHRVQMWGVFVEAAQRGRGLGKAVVKAALEFTRSWQGVDFVDVAVGEKSLHAKRLYESLGFEAWGREPEATDCDGSRYDEFHMTLRL